MLRYTRPKEYKSISALICLSLIGVGFLIFSFVVLICGFLINFHDDFDASNGGQSLEAHVYAQLDYTQYWLGIPLLITAILTIFSAVKQHMRTLNTITLVAFHICIVLALFAIILDGPDWVYWKNKDRLRQEWEDKTGYSCSQNGTNTCKCSTSGTAPISKTIDATTSCSNMETLSGLFGGVVASAIIAIFLAISGIVVFLKSVSWRKDENKYLVNEYDVSKNHQSYSDVVYKSSQNAQVTHEDKPYANGGFSGY